MIEKYLQQRADELIQELRIKEAMLGVDRDKPDMGLPITKESISVMQELQDKQHEIIGALNEINLILEYLSRG